MGMFKDMKNAMGAANEAMANSQQMQQQYGGGIPSAYGDGLQNLDQQATDRGSLEGQGHEFNRILTVGQAGTALIRGHVDAGEVVAGNPVWIFDLEVTPEGGQPYTVQHREIVSTMALNSYGDGTSMPCRIDPADPQKIAFGDKPFM
jgi:hypothetical protein